MEISKAVQTNAGGAVVSLDVEGYGNVDFPKMSTREVAAYGDEIKSKRREAIKASAKDSKLSEPQTFRAIQEADYEVGLEEIADYLNTPKKSIEIVEKSLKRASREADSESIISSIGIHGVRDLARKIAGTYSMFKKPETPPKPKPDDSGFGASGETPLP